MGSIEARFHGSGFWSWVFGVTSLVAGRWSFAWSAEWVFASTGGVFGVVRGCSELGLWFTPQSGKSGILSKGYMSQFENLFLWKTFIAG